MCVHRELRRHTVSPVQTRLRATRLHHLRNRVLHDLQRLRQLHDRLQTAVLYRRVHASHNKLQWIRLLCGASSKRSEPLPLQMLPRLRWRSLRAVRRWIRNRLAELPRSMLDRGAVLQRQRVFCAHAADPGNVQLHLLCEFYRAVLRRVRARIWAIPDVPRQLLQRERVMLRERGFGGRAEPVPAARQLFLHLSPRFRWAVLLDVCSRLRELPELHRCMRECYCELQR